MFEGSNDILKALSVLLKMVNVKVSVPRPRGRKVDRVIYDEASEIDWSGVYHG